MKMEEKSVDPPRTGARIYGHVFSHNGMILNGATLTYNGTETATLADGSYTFNDLLPGTYEIKVRLQGFQSIGENVYVPKDGESIQDFYLSEALGSAKLYGHVIDDATGKPVKEGTTILILPVANKYSHIKMDGYYEFTNLPAGTFTISTSVPGYEDGFTVLSLEENETKTHEFLCKAMKIEEPPWG
jgi:hypothetical protein